MLKCKLSLISLSKELIFFKKSIVFMKKFNFQKSKLNVIYNRIIGKNLLPIVREKQKKKFEKKTENRYLIMIELDVQNQFF